MAERVPYTVNCSILLTDLPLLERPAAARAAGFAGVEFWWPFASSTPAAEEVDAFVRAIDDAGVQLTGLNFNAGDMPGGDRGLVSWPARSAELRENLDVVADNFRAIERRFPGELRLPDVAAIIKVESKAELRDRCRIETRYYISSSSAPAAELAHKVRGHWCIENQLHWVLDVVFNEDQSRLRKGHGARNMAVVRHFALNLVRLAPEELIPERQNLKRKTSTPRKSKRKTPIKRRRQRAGWSTDYLAAILQLKPR